MPDLREVELRIAVAEGVLSRPEADALGEEARKRQQSPLALLVERGRLSEESCRSFLAAAMNDPAWGASGHEASASTFTMQGPPPTPGEPAFPVAAWDRYSCVRFLGQGGMGMVFLAVDTRLRREVAIKFVRGDDADHVRRLISEARTQARVIHERICKVYEVGEVEGKVYIAMQYISGAPLGRCVGELTLEQKVMLIRGAADGIHEAHRAGIIHRDLKPSNIMVERGDDGEIRPYVMDFGLARSAQEAGTTQTGTVLGTPRYMAPEQANGPAAKLDRRADVYSLGATLYHLLTGEPPVPGETVAEVIHNLISGEPRALRAHDPNIPIDLEAIVLRCLEKDRSARYDSARALADDLARFMNGEPVVARPVGAWYRLRKRLAKQRRLVAVAGVALVLLLGAIGWGIKTSSEAAERERLARRFTERVERIEAAARYSALAPLHDIRPDRAALRAQMSDLDGEIQRTGELAAGPGHYALGCGYLALDDDDQARAQLESAWHIGFREPRVAYALAQALGHLYQQGLLTAERIDNKDLSEARKREIEKQYRDPARRYLAESRGAEVISEEYVAALMAFYEGKLDEALQHLDPIRGRLPWFYEAPELRGDILRARGQKLHDQGDDARSVLDFDAGRKAYSAAAAIGESVPSIYKSQGDLEYAAMAMALYGKGDVMAPVDRALAATGRALAVVPDHYEALVLQALVRRRLADHQATEGSSQGHSVDDVLATALGDAQRATKVAPARPEARLAMAQIYRQWGDVRSNRHDDPSEQYRQAIAISDGILPRDRDASYYGNLGLTFSTWADYQAENHVDAQANYEKAIDAYTRALQRAEVLQLPGQLGEIWTNLGINLFARASQPHARDPDGDLHRALAALDKARALIPTHPVRALREGDVHVAIAQRAQARALDPGPDLDRAIAAYRAGLVNNPKYSYLHNGLGGALIARASAAWERGGKPEPLLDQAQQAFEHAIALAPALGYGYDNVGEVHIQRAWYQRARDEDPGAAVRAAADMLHQAIERIPNYSTFWADLGMAYTILAAYELDRGRDPQPSLDLASKAIATAIEKTPNDAQAQLYLGETRGIGARLAAQRRRGKPGDFAAAAEAFQKAIDLAPENQDYQIAFGQFCRAWAAFQRDTGGEPAAVLDRGLRLANQVLTARPAWPDALVLRASLALLRAQSSSAPERRAQAASAAQDFATALHRNPALDKVWAAQQAQAQLLTGSP